MAESAKSLWTKIRYDQRQCCPDLRYGRFDISLWTPDLKGGVKPQWHGSYPGLGRFSEHFTKDQILCVFVMLRITPGESKMNIVSAFSDGPESISLVWGTLASNLKPVTARVSRGMGSQLWHD